jgi:predicted membrane channel-forming protein YqfA (hemolysin III family)
MSDLIKHILFGLLVPLILGKVVLDNSSVETWSHTVLTLLFVVVAWNGIRFLYHDAATKTTETKVWLFLFFVIGSIALVCHTMYVKRFD